jgi:uncharacterized protein with HEPN domain
MQRRDWRLRVEDILEAIQRIDAYLQGLDYAAFVADRRTADAVLRNLEIVGEAAHHIPPEVRRRHPQMPWSVMRGIRNRLAHAYFAVDLTVIWDTSTQDLHPLVPELERMLHAAPTPPAEGEPERPTGEDKP